jgi:RNA polymerase sigma-70 factor, ECF subfamily
LAGPDGLQPKPDGPTDPDALLMVRVREGDDAAFAQLIENNHHYVMNLGWRYFHDRQLAEDVAQEAFLRAYNGRHNYRPEAKFRTWLLRKATNLCISKLRKKRIVARSLTFGEDEREREVHDQLARDPAEEPERTELQEHVRAAIADLPERQRVAIILARFHGLTYPELEEALGLSRMALKSLLHRARESLRVRLAEYVRAEESRRAP